MHLNIKEWTEEGKKEWYEKNDVVSKAMLVNQYKDSVFDIPNADNKTFYVGKNKIG